MKNSGQICITLTGPRQSGKSTLVRALFADLLYVLLAGRALSMHRGSVDRTS